MEVQGICTICGKAAKMHTCLLCGRLVCADCYHFDKGVCNICKKNIRENKKSI